MKHTIVITYEDGAKATFIYQYLTGVALVGRCLTWVLVNAKSAGEATFATEDEARAAYDKINEGLEAWLGRNDPPVMTPLRSNDLGDFRYEVMAADFCAHGEIYDRGDVIEYDPAVSPSRWQYWMDEPAALIKQVPRDTT